MSFLRKVAVLQSNYIPWKGYFDIIHDVDMFIFYDEVQFTIRDWRNRNLIIINGEPRWISVPVGDKIHQKISEVAIKDNHWQKKHFNSLQTSYGRSPYFRKYEDFFRYVYLEKKWEYLYLLNRFLIESISRDFLHIPTKFYDSRSFPSTGQGSDKLLSLLQSAGAEVYVSGPAAQSYMKPKDFENAGIQIVWKDYRGYPSYAQKSKVFTHNVSILDLLFQTGEDAPYYIWGWRK